MIKKIHHIAIIVPDLSHIEKIYQAAFSLSFEKVVPMPEYRVEVGFMTVGEVWLEFICPTGDEPKFTPFLREHGPGLHHIAYQVDDIRKAMNQVQAAGVGLENQEPIKGADGSICFLRAKDLGGVYTELVQVLQI
jgi:methylmalonyl-CoA epimerase